MRTSLAIICAASGLLLAACDIAGFKSAAEDKVAAAASAASAPTVSSVYPAGNATGVARTVAISATFSEAMSPASIKTTTFTVSQGAVSVTGTVGYNSANASATFTPSAPLALNATYTAAISTGARDLEGNPLKSDFAWQFTTTDGTGASLGITYQAVVGGSFQRDGTAANTSQISSFHMSTNLITSDQFHAISGLSDVATPPTTDYPVNCNWYAALVFCNRLSMADSKTPVYSINGSTDPANWGAMPSADTNDDNPTWDHPTINAAADGYRLPTEMEYMWAMMGGMSDKITANVYGGVNTQGYQKGYSGSGEAGGGQASIATYAWYFSTNVPNRHPVGQKSANELGIKDLSGNVYEWCWDLYLAGYPSGANTNYAGPDRASTSGQGRVLRGGRSSDGSTTLNCAVGSRSWASSCSAGGSDYSRGFRVVYSP
jgi:formylglycine-generating enzyme required for sulfatase activity